MKRIFVVLILFAVLHQFASAQDKKTPSATNLTLIFDSGLLIGHGESYYPAPFSSNISFLIDGGKQFMFGAGTGVEVIGKTFLPLFIDLRFIPIKSKPFFIYNRTGGTFCMNKNYSAEENSDYYYRTYPHPLNENVNTSGGIINELGFGVYLNRADWKTSFSIGYSYQTTSDKVEISPKMTYQNTFNRVAFRVGFWF